MAAFVSKEEKEATPALLPQSHQQSLKNDRLRLCLISVFQGAPVHEKGLSKCTFAVLALWADGGS